MCIRIFMKIIEFVQKLSVSAKNGTLQAYKYQPSGKWDIGRPRRRWGETILEAGTEDSSNAWSDDNHDYDINDVAHVCPIVSLSLFIKWYFYQWHQSPRSEPWTFVEYSWRISFYRKRLPASCQLRTWMIRPPYLYPREKIFPSYNPGQLGYLGIATSRTHFCGSLRGIKQCTQDKVMVESSVYYLNVSRTRSSNSEA
jgi:hypothetical protein